jgi:transposase
MRELIIGVDLHQRQASYAVIDRTQTVYAEEEIANEDRDRIRAFLQRWQQPETTTTLIVEATGGWYWFVDFVKPLVDRVKLADTFWSAQCLKGRAAKNDRIDALDLAKLEIRGQVEEGYQMPRELREVRDVLRTRMRLVQERTAVKNRIRAVLTKNGIRFSGADLCGPGGQTWLAAQALPEAWRLQIDEQLRLIAEYDRSIGRLEGFAKRSEGVRSHPHVKLLESIPGVGPIWAMTIALEIADVNRFKYPEELVCYAGLAPTLHQSSNTKRYFGLHLHRNVWLKGALGMVARTARKVEPLASEFERALLKYKKMVCTLIIARKLARIIFWMLTRKEKFRGSSPKAVLTA